MANPCSYSLKSGRPCGAPALRDSNRCRHHSPKLPKLSQNGNASSGSGLGYDPDTGEGYVLTKATLAAYWRSTVPRDIRGCETEEHLRDPIEMLLDALAEKQICHRSAGRLFAMIARRRDEIRSAERHRQASQRQTPNTGDHLEALKNVPGVDQALLDALKQLTQIQSFPR